MKVRQALERVVELTADIKGRLTALLDLYGSLDPIVKREHEAIAAGDMGAVAKCQERKTSVTHDVEHEFGGLQNCCRELAQLRHHYDEEFDLPKTVTLRDTLDHIRHLGGCLPDGEFERQLVMYQLKNVEALVDAFDHRVKQVQPLLEMNMYIVSKMLGNIQQSYRFHMSLVEQEASAYSEKGVKKSDGNHSGFKVGA